MKIVWTKRARVRLEEILNYIENEFGRTARDEFRARAKDFTKLLLEFPEIGSLQVKDKGIRGFPISKQNKVFYQVKKTRITILTLFDTRQDPQKRPR